jgi:hypothetical protein
VDVISGTRSSSSAYDGTCGIRLANRDLEEMIARARVDDRSFDYCSLGAQIRSGPEPADPIRNAEPEPLVAHRRNLHPGCRPLDISISRHRLDRQYH